jgi:N-acetylglucosamine kinase-like BadF-type ATPase
MGSFFIGVDGGGTKTMGVIAGEDGKVIGQDEVGSTNHHSNPIDVVQGNLGSLIGNLLKSAKAEAGQVDTICLGMAGVDRPEDKPLIKGIIAEFLPRTQCIPVNDGIIALVGGAEKPVGIIVIAGTGSIAFGFNAAGQSARAGGWGHILGDEGSGYMLGLRALRAVVRAYDGRTEPTKLHDIVLRHLELERPEQLLAHIKKINAGKAEIGSLSRLVFDANDEGDATAAAIIREEAAELADAARAVARKLFPSSADFEIVVGGGNLRKCEAYFAAFQQEVAARLPGIPVIHPRREPVEGAVLYAIQNKGQR